MNKELEAVNKWLKEYLTLCEKLNTNQQEKMLLNNNSPYNILKTYFESVDNANPNEALNITKATEKYTGIDLSIVKQALQRLNKYEEILSKCRLTDRNYKNTTLDIDSCKPYLRLGQLEDIYEDGKKNE